MNKNPKNPFFQKLDEPIKILVDKYGTKDRQWKYNFEECRFRTYEELVARREDCKYEDQLYAAPKINQKILD